MFKRVIWIGIGAAAGSASTVWTQRKVRAQVDRVAELAAPSHAVAVAKDRVDTARETVKAAVTEGRSVRRNTESELRRAVDERWGRRVP